MANMRGYDDADTRFSAFDRPATMVPGWEAQYRFGPIPGLGAFGQPSALQVLDPRTIRAVDPQPRNGYYRGDAPAIGRGTYVVRPPQDAELDVFDVRCDRTEDIGWRKNLGVMVVPDFRAERREDLTKRIARTGRISGLGLIESTSAPGPQIGIPATLLGGGAIAYFAADLLPVPWNLVGKIAGAGAALFGIVKGIKSIVDELSFGKPSPAIVTPLQSKDRQVVVLARIDKPFKDEAVRLFFSRSYPVEIRLLNDSDEGADVNLSYVADEFGIGLIQDKKSATYVETLALPPKQWVSVKFDMPTAHLGFVPSIHTVGTLRINDAVVGSVNYNLG